MIPDTSKTVVGVFSNAEQAKNAIAELEQAGFPQSGISMVVRSDQHPVQLSEVATDAEIGAAAGSIGGALLGVAASAVPGIGPVLAIGPILGALGGAGIGAVTGGFIGALTDAGVPAEEAHFYAEGVRRGDAIVTVRTDQADAQRAVEIMDANGALDIEGRFGQHRGVEPFSEDELRRERGWPHHEAHDLGGSLTEVAAPKGPPERRA
jgi:uncharacterized membrane protein